MLEQEVGSSAEIPNSMVRETQASEKVNYEQGPEANDMNPENLWEEAFQVEVPAHAKAREVSTCLT